MSEHIVTKNKGGAPRGNKNRTLHGLRASGLPNGCTYIRSSLSSLRTLVRNELEQRQGGGRLELYQEACLQSAVRHETRALLVARWLRLAGDELDIDKRISLLRDLSNATDARDRCLKELGLDKSPAADDWPAVITAVATPTAPIDESMDTPQDSVSGAKNPGTPEQTPRAESALNGEPEAQKRLTDEN